MPCLTTCSWTPSSTAFWGLAFLLHFPLYTQYVPSLSLTWNYKTILSICVSMEAFYLDSAFPVKHPPSPVSTSHTPGRILCKDYSWLLKCHDVLKLPHYLLVWFFFLHCPGNCTVYFPLSILTVSASPQLYPSLSPVFCFLVVLVTLCVPDLRCTLLWDEQCLPFHLWSRRVCSWSLFLLRLQPPLEQTQN